MKNKKDYIGIIVIILLFISSVDGVLSVNFLESHFYINQYAHTVKLYGYGIYARDTYFKAPISIGTDFCILLVFIPMFIYTYINYLKKRDNTSKLKLMSVYAVSLYYSASLAFGVTYNRLFLVYLLLFSLSLFEMFYYGITYKGNTKIELTNGIKVFLIISGIALIVAWLPDIIPSLITGETLSLIGNYTTEITYVIDMGILSPLCFIAIYLLKNNNRIGTIILSCFLKLCFVVGIMMIPQGLFQYLSQADIPVIALITKSLSFVLLGVYAYILNNKLYKKLELSK